MRPPQLDDTDWAILRELQEDARLSFAELGRRVGLSSPAVQERVRRMEDTGVIKRYRADIDPTKVGFPIIAHSRLRQVNGRDRAAVTELIRSIPEIIHCIDITGEDGFVLTIIATSHAHLDDILVRFIPYGQTITGILMKTYVDHRTIEKETCDYDETAE
ncbi:MAG: Lrp/AsnC family transcriptional regulator [Chloroflexota bacterium]